MQGKLTFLSLDLSDALETNLDVGDGHSSLSICEGGLVGVNLFFNGSIQGLGPVFLTIFKSPKIRTEPAVVKRCALNSSLFNSLLCHINHVLVQAFVDVRAQVKFLSNWVEHRIFLLVKGAGAFLLDPCL